MKRTSIIASTIIVVLLASGCNSASPDYTDAKAFVSDFISALNQNSASRFDAFFFKSADFDQAADGAEMARERITGIVRQEFLRQCNLFVQNFGSKKLTLVSIDLKSTKPRAVRFLSNVGQNYSEVEVILKADDEFVLTIIIDEVVQVGDKWRLSTFMTIVDFGTDTTDPIKIPMEDDDEEGESDQ